MPELFLGLTGEDWQAVWLSVRVSLTAVALSLPFGIAAGWVLARKSFRARRWPRRS
jgi:molybdate transport system permease protein